MLVVAADVDAAHRMLQRITGRLDRPTELLSRMADNLVEYERDVFATRDGGSWGTADLVDSGDLMAKLTGRPNLDLGEDAVEAQGTDYAGYLKAGARGMPPRDPAPQPPAHVTEKWSRDVLDTLLGGL